MNKQKKTKDIGIFHSIKTKVLGVVLLTVVVVTIFVIWTIIPITKNNITELSINEIYNLSVAYGTQLDALVNSAPDGESQFLSTEFLTKQYADLTLKSYDSGYIYVVKNDGTMIYHPTEDKIGKPVENEVISGVVEQLKDTTTLEPQAVKYPFKGKNKYAGYYVGKEGNFILVVSANEEDTMGIINFIFKRTIEGSVIAAILACMIGFVIIHFLMKPLLNLTKSIQKMHDFDFSEDAGQKVLEQRKDETGSISRAVGIMRKKLMDMTETLTHQSISVNEAAEKMNNSAIATNDMVIQIEQSVHEIAKSANAQSDETQTATENVVSIGNMIGNTTHRLEELTAKIETMHQASNEADATLKELDLINQQAKNAIETIYTQTNMTNQSVIKIKEATNLITSIAEETNLLALNASIEAARAGENGKGFAVVAAQIQKLAEQSNQSAQHIESIITSLITDSEKAVETMDEVKNIMEQQNANIEKTGKSFSEVSEEIIHSNDSIKTITQEARKIDEARKNVVDVVQNLTAISQENSAVTEETSASASEVGEMVSGIAKDAENLKKVAEQLEESMRIFKL